MEQCGGCVAHFPCYSACADNHPAARQVMACKQRRGGDLDQRRVEAASLPCREITSCHAQRQRSASFECMRRQGQLRTVQAAGSFWRRRHSPHRGRALLAQTDQRPLETRMPGESKIRS